MPLIQIDTIIHAPIERVFDLNRSIELHMISTSASNEKAVAGKTTGLIGLGETVTWRARHFGLYQHLTVKITEFDQPYSFTDEQVNGIFSSFKHQHIFESTGGNTFVKDVFQYKSPLGSIGRIADVLFLKKYMTQLLEIRNQTIKTYAETELWKTALQPS